MDRRSALARLAVTGTAFGAASSVLTSTAFADGGSVRCRPTTPTTAVTWTIDAESAVRVRMRVTPGSFAAVTCPCPTPATSIVEYRYTLDAASAALSIYDTAGGSPIGNTWLSTNDPTPVVRLTAGGPLPSPTTYTIRWTVRWKCNGAIGRAWRCRSWIASVTFTSVPPDANITAQSESSPGTPCDTTPL